MAVRKKGDMTVHRARPCNYPVHAGANLLRSFPSRAAIAEKHPSGRPAMDLLRGKPFVFTIVPLDQIVIDLSAVTETG
jgi:hypothetical protein